MATFRRDWSMAPLFVALVATSLGGCSLVVRHQGILDVLTNMGLGYPDPTSGVDLFGGNLSCVGDCAMDCASCDACDGCSSCDSCDCSSCGACTDCAACDGCACAIVPHTFDVGARIPNAAQVRLTRGGLEFIEGTVAPLVTGMLPALDIETIMAGTELPEQIDQFFIGTNGTAPDFLMEARNVSISAEQDGLLRVTLDIWGASTTDGVRPGVVPMRVHVNDPKASGTVVCDIDIDASRGSFSDGFRVTADVRLVEETSGPRVGYARLEVSRIDFVESSIEPEDVDVSCSGGLKLVLFGTKSPDELLNGFSDFGVTIGLDKFDHGSGSATSHTGGVAQLVSEILDHLRHSVEQFLDYHLGEFLVDQSGDPRDGVGPWRMCQQVAAPSTCPDGTSFEPTNSVCIIEGTGRCLETLLGLEGRVDVGAAESVVTPGIEAVIDFLFAAQGDSRASSSGLNIDFFGGLEHLGHNECVPVTPPQDIPTPPRDIPIATALSGNLLPNPSNPRAFDVGIGISESYLNYALWKLWDAGTLCLNVGTALDQQLSGTSFTGLFIAGPNSLAQVTFPFKPTEAAFGLSVRPLTAPVVTFGDADPNTALRLVNVALDDFNLDFYAWTQDKYVRLFTLQTDLVVGLDIPIADNTITIDAANDLDLIMNDPEIVNGELVTANHESLAGLIAGLAQTIAAGLGGSIPNIPLDDMLAGAALPGGIPLPVGISLSSDSLWPIEQPRPDGTKEHFLGVFIDLVHPPAATGLTARAETSVEVTNVTLPEDRAGFAARTFQQGSMPTVEIAMSATGPGGAEYEYSYRLSNSGWSEWSASPYAIIEDPSLFLQQWHTVHARARIKGRANTTDFTAAEARFLVDADAPVFQVVEADGAVMLEAYDVVADIEDVEYRYRNPSDDAWSEWVAMADLDAVELEGATPDVEVEVRDPSGNVGTNVQALRGLPDPSAASGGCGSCATGAPSGNGRSPLAYLGTALVLGLALARRQRR